MLSGASNPPLKDGKDGGLIVQYASLQNPWTAVTAIKLLLSNRSIWLQKTGNSKALLPLVRQQGFVALMPPAGSSNG
jgi:hypothetical protein